MVRGLDKRMTKRPWVDLFPVRLVKKRFNTLLKMCFEHGLENIANLKPSGGGGGGISENIE